MEKPFFEGVKKVHLIEVEHRVFAYSEDTHDLCLASELADLRSGYANPRCCLWHNDLVRSDGSAVKRKEKQTIG